MIQVQMSRDIREYSPKVISVLDLRQVVCVALSASYGLPILMMATGLPIEVRIMFAVLLMFPVAACGWINFQGMPFEKLVVHIVKNRILTPHQRIYRTKNMFDPDEEKIPDKAEKQTRKEKKLRKAEIEKYGGVF